MNIPYIYIYKFANVPVNSGRIDAERYGIARTANSSVDSARDLDIGAMVLALRAWKFDPRRILRATRDITLSPSFNRRKLFARFPAVASGRRIESSKPLISRLVLRTFGPSLLRSSNLVRLPTNVLGMPTPPPPPLSLTEVFAPRIMKSSVYPSAIRFVLHRPCFRSSMQTSAL